MNPEHKIWAILQVLVEASELAPKGHDLIIDPKSLEEYMNLTEAKQILRKFAEEEKIIEITFDPNSFTEICLDGDPYAFHIRITDESKFKEFYNKAHFKFFGSLEKLTGEKFLAISDVAQDIFEKLSTSPSNEIYIPIYRDIIRYNILCPARSPNLMDRYCNLRMEATKYLKENGHIENYSVTRENWNSTITIIVDRLNFTKFYNRLIEIYPKKIKHNKEKKEDNNENTPDLTKTGTTGTPTININNYNQQTNIDSADNESRDRQNTQNKRDGLCPNTKWENINIEFLNGHDVRIKYDSQSIDSNYVKMGFEDSRKKNPNTQWDILKHMSDKERFISFADAEPKICRNLKSQKKELSQKLKDFFGIKDDPFQYIGSEAGTGYLAKFQMTAEGGKTKTYLGNYK